MKKLLILIFLVILFIGCSEEKYCWDCINTFEIYYDEVPSKTFTKISYCDKTESEIRTIQKLSTMKANSPDNYETRTTMECVKRE